MDLAKVAAGDAPPREINVVVEIPQGGLVKYEYDPETGVLMVDRFLETAMVYPGNYGFVPQTLGEDGDPLDALVIAPTGIQPGAVVRCRPVAVLLMEDDKGPDAKIVAVPRNASAPAGLPAASRDQIAHFFAHYKDLDEGKWSKILGWGEADEAEAMITAALDRAAKKRG